MSKAKICKLCESGLVREVRGINVFFKDGKACAADMVYYVCDHCESEYADGEQIRRNCEAAV